jgi:hypothetical protein
MLGVSPWVWAWLGALAPSLRFARTIIWVLLVNRVTKIVVEKADVKDLPQVLAGLGVLVGVLAGPSRLASLAVVCAEPVTGDVAVRDGGPAL